MTQPKQKMIPADVAKTERLQLRKLKEKAERIFFALEESLEIEASETFNSFSPTIDLCETNDAVCISVELPGVSPDEINLVVTAKEISISGEKTHSSNTSGAISHFCCERQYGKFERNIKLRWAININETEAKLENGILKVKMPKLTERRGKSIRIPVKTEE